MISRLIRQICWILPEMSLESLMEIYYSMNPEAVDVMT